MREFTALPAQQRTMLTLTTDDILGQAREALRCRPHWRCAVALPADGGVAQRPRSRNDVLDPNDPNVMRVVKRMPEASASAVPPDRTTIAKAGDTITSILLELGAVRDDVRLIAAAFTRGGREITLRDGQRIRVLFAQGPAGRQQPVRVILVGERGTPEAAVAQTDEGRYVAVEDPAEAANVTDDPEDDEDDGGGLRLSCGHLRDRAPPGNSAAHRRRADPGLRQRRRFLAPRQLQRPLRGALCLGRRRRGRSGGHPLCRADRRRRDAPLLSLPFHRRRRHRLLRRAGQVGAQVPHPQADRRRPDAVRLRHAPPSGDGLFQDAFRRRLVRSHRHADRRRRQWRHRQGELVRGLWPPHRDRAPQRLHLHLFAPVRALPAASPRARGSGRDRSSAISAIRASRPDLTSTTR